MAARRAHVLHAVALLHHVAAACKVAAVAMVVVNSVATATTVATLRVLKVVATTVHAQKAALTTEATTARHVKTRRAVTAPHVAMAMSCPATSTL